jgi:hypothetical protein
MSTEEITLSSLQRELQAHAAKGGVRYAASFKSQVVTYTEARRRSGAGYKKVSAELGLAFETVRRWCLGRSKSRKLRAVQITPTSSSRTFAAVSPSGVRIEGLSLDDAAALLRALG